ncbi:hypothetical protein [Streptomyces celluloflavus]|uniref:hypothetical protein n=1 Tax=Streptomyces celluloflavus TaxID=58344 RepID=UPI00364A67CF
MPEVAAEAVERREVGSGNIVCVRLGRFGHLGNFGADRTVVGREEHDEILNLHGNPVGERLLFEIRTLVRSEDNGGGAWSSVYLDRCE